MVRHSNQDALSDDEYERLLKVALTLDPPFDAETYLIFLLGGRLGMRAGEISHMRADWIDWDRNQIRIPNHEPCDCGYCRYQARQALEYDPSLVYEDVLARRWKPKTSNSARPIPFDFDAEIETCLKAFFEFRDAYPRSRASINRRVDRVARAAGIDKGSIYPHALRATAATFHAYRGVPAVPLQALMGWEQLATAQKYIRLSGSATAKALREVHSI